MHVRALRPSLRELPRGPTPRRLRRHRCGRGGRARQGGWGSARRSPAPKPPHPQLLWAARFSRSLSCRSERHRRHRGVLWLTPHPCGMDSSSTVPEPGDGVGRRWPHLLSAAPFAAVPVSKGSAHGRPRSGGLGGRSAGKQLWFNSPLARPGDSALNRGNYDHGQMLPARELANQSRSAPQLARAAEKRRPRPSGAAPGR